MVQILAKQLIYTRVEAPFSPTHKSGYQVVYATPGLKQNVVDSIVKKVSEFQPHLPDLKRWQCFFLENNSIVVINQTQLIDSDPEIIDKDSRRGILVAHCLILDWSDYKLANFEPFQFIEQFGFVTSAKEMVQRYSKSDGKESPALFDLIEYTNYEIDSPWMESLHQLVLTGAPQFVESKSSLLLYGDDREIFNALKMLFLFSPPSYREKLTFDTYIKGRQVSIGEFWAVGLPEWKSGYSVAIDTNNKLISNAPKNFEDMYLLWLQKRDPKSLELETVLAVQEISDSFHYKKVPNKDQLTDIALASFFEIHQQSILAQLLSVVGRTLSKNISVLFVSHLERSASLYDLISIAATELFSAEMLTLLLREWFVSFEIDFATISKDDWDTVKQLAMNAKDHTLALWCAAFTTDKKLFQGTVRSLTANEYSYALKLLAQPLTPLSLFVPAFVSQFVLVLAQRLDHVNGEDYVEIIDEILASKGFRELEPIMGLVSQLDNKELTRLEKLTVKQPIPPRFRTLIEKRRSELGPRYTIMDALFGRKSD